MEQSRINYLYRRFQSRELTAPELAEWESIIQDNKYDEQIQKLIDSEWQNGGDLIGMDSKKELERTYAHIIRHKQHKRQVGRTLIRWLPYAAVALLVLGISIFLLKDSGQNIAEIETQIVDVLPGGNRAFLTLSDGTVIHLSSEETGIVVGKEITYESGGEVLNKSAGDVESETLQLVVPKGGIYTVTLHDGTKVWLNSGSTLRYPPRFEESGRVVELEGEAFFDVSRVSHAALSDLRPSEQHHDQQLGSKNSEQNVPFFVKTNTQIIEVLGTSFNVSAYADDPTSITTLVEGAVRVASFSAQDSNVTDELSIADYVQLKPGEQSIQNKGMMSKKSVEIKPYVAWKDGVFYFDETKLSDAMSQLSRWYDVDIVYSGAKPPNTYFFGEIKRSKSLAFVLEILETSGVKFKITNEGGKNVLIVL